MLRLEENVLAMHTAHGPCIIRSVGIEKFGAGKKDVMVEITIVSTGAQISASSSNLVPVAKVHPGVKVSDVMRLLSIACMEIKNLQTQLNQAENLIRDYRERERTVMS